MSRFRTTLTVVIGAAFFFLSLQPAEAAFKLRISDGTTTKVIQDWTGVGGSGGDANDAEGSIAYFDNSSFTGWSFTLTVGASKPLTSPNPSFENRIDIAVQATSQSNANALTIDITDTGFLNSGLPENELILISKANSFSGIGSMTLQSWVDLDNREFGGIPPLNSGNIYSTGLQNGSNSVARVASLIFPGSNPFSITSRTVLTPTVGSSNNFWSIDNETTVVTPAPPAWALVLAGAPVLGIGIWRRRRKAM